MLRALIVPSFGIICMLTVCGMSSAQAATGSVTYTYDALGRVTSASYDTGVLILYAYDANGNRTQQIVNVNTATLNWNTNTPCTNDCWGGTVWG